MDLVGVDVWWECWKVLWRCEVVVVWEELCWAWCGLGWVRKTRMQR